MLEKIVLKRNVESMIDLAKQENHQVILRQGVTPEKWESIKAQGCPEGVGVTQR